MGRMMMLSEMIETYVEENREFINSLGDFADHFIPFEKWDHGCRTITT